MGNSKSKSKVEEAITATPTLPANPFDSTFDPEAYRLTVRKRNKLPVSLRHLPEAARQRLTLFARQAAKVAPTVKANAIIGRYINSIGEVGFSGENSKEIATAAANAVQSVWREMQKDGVQSVKLCRVRIAQAPDTDKGTCFHVIVERGRDGAKREAKERAALRYAASAEY